MRVFVKSEPEAFRLTLAVLAVVAVCVLVGYLLGVIVGIALFGAIVAVALLADLIRSKPHADLRAAERSGHEHAEGQQTRRILVIANEALTDEALESDLFAHDGSRPVLEVIAPVLQSKSHFVTTDIDTETQAARRRLRQTLRCAAEHGIQASGVVGDPITPMATVEDELRRYDVEEVIVATHPLHDANWLETRILERASDELSVPIRHLVIDSAATGSAG